MVNFKGDNQTCSLCAFKEHNIFILNIQTYNTAACEFQQCGILTSVDSDEPVQPPVKLRNSKCCWVSSLTVNNRIFKRLAKALTRLRLFAGWSEPLLVPHATLLEISCCSSIVIP